MPHVHNAAMLWIKAFHIVFVASWFAGLFYLPRLFVNLCSVPADSHAERERLLLMARKLYRFASLLMIPAVGLGLWLWLANMKAWSGGWLHVKIVLVVLNRTTSPVSNAVVQVPQGISTAEYVATSQSQSAAAQATRVNGSQVTVTVGARSISTVVLTL
jgi:uncharacterized membrane protein